MGLEWKFALSAHYKLSDFISSLLDMRSSHRTCRQLVELSAYMPKIYYRHTTSMAEKVTWGIPPRLERARAHKIGAKSALNLSLITAFKQLDECFNPQYPHPCRQSVHHVGSTLPPFNRMPAESRIACKRRRLLQSRSPPSPRRPL